MFEIRDTRADDRPQIWPFFRRIVAAGDTFTYPRDMTQEAARALWMKRPPGRPVVAAAPDETVLGTAESHYNAA